MKKSLYEFGGSEKDVYDAQKYFLNYFKNCKNVLDVGCGRGVFMQMLKNIGVNCMGIDGSDESLKFCVEKKLNVQKYDAITFLKNNINKFDGIFLGQIIEHFSYDDANILLECCNKSLKKGGTLGIITPNPASFQIISETFWLDPTHIRPYPLPLLEKMVQKNRFEVIDARCLIRAESHNFATYFRRFFESVQNMKRTGINSYVVAIK